MTETEVLRWLAEIFEASPESISAATPRTDIPAWDSLGVLTLIAGFDERFGLQVSDADLEKLATIGDVVALLKSKGKLSS